MKNSKYVFLIVLLFLSALNCKGQFHDSSNYIVKAQLPERKLKICFVKLGHSGKLILTHTLLNKTDTMLLAEFADASKVQIDSCSIQSFESPLTKEWHIIPHWQSHESDNLGEHGAFGYDKTIHQIWNSKGVRIFSAISQSNYHQTYMDWPTDSTSTLEQTNCSYRYDFTIDGSGKILISNIREILSGNCSEYTADHREGTYVIFGGKYKHIEKRK